MTEAEQPPARSGFRKLEIQGWADSFEDSGKCTSEKLLEKSEAGILGRDTSPKTLPVTQSPACPRSPPPTTTYILHITSTTIHALCALLNLGNPAYSWILLFTTGYTQTLEDAS